MIKNSDLIKNKGEKYGIDDLLAIMERLRQPDGCPWDREQDHHSIRNDFIEETYEVAEAIDRENRGALRGTGRCPFADSFSLPDRKGTAGL